MHKDKYSRFSRDPQSARKIPARIARKAFFSFLIWFGSIFLISGLLFATVFALAADWSSLKFGKNSPTVTGTVTKIESTSASVNDLPVMAYTFMYKVNGKEYQSVSYSEKHSFEVGNPVEVEYLRPEPQTSRIKETRRGLFGIGFLPLLLIFPGIGGVFVWLGIRKGLHNVAMLRYGKITYGQLINKVSTNTRINNQTVYKLIFRFEANGAEYEAIGKSHQPARMEDETVEMILYDPARPTRSVVVDEMPELVRVFLKTLPDTPSAPLHADESSVQANDVLFK